MPSSQPPRHRSLSIPIHSQTRAALNGVIGASISIVCRTICRVTASETPQRAMSVLRVRKGAASSK